MLGRVILAVVIAVVVTLGCALLGGILASLNVTIAVVIGQFLEAWDAVIGVLAALWYFFNGPHY